MRSSVDEETSNAYGSLVHDLVRRTRHGVRDLDPANDLTFFRIRTKKHEIMVVPGSLIIQFYIFSFSFSAESVLSIFHLLSESPIVNLLPYSYSLYRKEC